MRLLVTGVLGFIGSHFARHVLNNFADVSVVGIARNTDQRALRRINDIIKHPSFRLSYCDIATGDVTEVFEDIDYAVNFAAKTFVDHSIRDPGPFIQSNIVGTYRLLEEARKSRRLKKMVQISTDEVYGAILDGAYREDAPLRPSNPYAAAKAAGDMLSLAYYNTYGVPVLITRTENNYGPFQHPQKVFPTFVRKALAGESLPVYGDGKHRRMWLYVDDHCRAIMHLLEHGNIGEIYHIAGEEELENLELAKWILQILGKSEEQIAFIDDFDIRPGHDRRYALDVTKLRDTGWKPEYPLREGIVKTVEWYRDNQWWQQ